MATRIADVETLAEANGWTVTRSLDLVRWTFSRGEARANVKLSSKGTMSSIWFWASETADPESLTIAGLLARLTN